MNENKLKLPGLSQNKAAIIAAIGLLTNIVIAPAAYFGILPGIIGTGDAVAAIGNILASEQPFRIAICLLTLNVIADIVVFWALYSFLKPISKSVSFLALLFGILQAVVGLLSINNLSALLHMASRAAPGSPLNVGMFHAQAATAIDAFNWAWQAGFIMFGVHLLLRGWLFFRMQKWLGVALLVTATGYLVDGFGQILISTYNNPILTVYVGLLEALLPVWLLVKGRKMETP